MKTRVHFINLALFSVELFFSACHSYPAKGRSYQPDQAHNENEGKYITSLKFPNLQYRVQEIARDTTKALASNHYNEIDGNSSLVVEFKHSADGIKPSVSLRRAQLITDQILTIAQERQEISQPIDLNDPAAVQSKVNQERAHEQNLRNAITADLPQRMKSAGLPPKSVTISPSSSYQDIIAVLTQQLKAEQNKLADERDKAPSTKVVVSGFVYPANGQRRPIHVDGFDTLNDEKFQPISHVLPINPQGADAQQLVAETLKEAKNVETASKLLIENARPHLQMLRASLRPIDEQLSLAAGWVKKAPLSTRQVATPMTQKISELKAAFEEISLKEEFVLSENIPAAIQEIRALKRYLEAAKQLPVRMLKSLPPESLQESLGHFAVSATIASKLESDQGLEWLETTLSRNVVFDVATDSVKGSGVPIRRDMKDLVTGRIELDRSGWSLGDQVEVKIILTEETKSDDEKAKNGKPDTGSKSEGGTNVLTEERITYKGEAILAGVYRQVGADLIFARGFGSGDARKWKTNVAAHTDWHYFIRDAGSWGGFWNWVDPGIGLHVASLDQGPESIEFGMGGNITLFKNLLVGGYGYNFSTNHPYVYIGLNLLDVLNKAKPKLMKFSEGS